MKRLQLNSIRILALSGLALTFIQIFFHLRGKELCFNDGCSLVEGYIRFSPFIVNTIGSAFFLAVLGLTFLVKKNKGLACLLLDLLILCGLVSEGILLSIQLFIAHSFCSYCLIICAIIFLIAITYRPKLFVTGLVLVALETVFFSMIKLPYAGNVSLNSGTYAVKTCSNPVSVAYLIFSERCPHCQKVLDALHGCVSCEIHFNPVSKVDRQILPGLLPIENYRPEINVLALKLFGINSVPVIIEQTGTGFGIIKGDKAIIDYIHEKCFCGRGKEIIPVPSNGLGIFSPSDSGVCSMDQECK